MLEGKSVLLGVTGSIAAYKAAALASLLVKQGAEVNVVMTKNAAQFVTPVTFETLTGRRAPVDTFDRNFEYSVEHIALAKKTDLVMIAPASADVIAKLANGIADDMLTTTVLACSCPKLVAPAMNTGMYENPVTQDNLKKLRHYGWKIVEGEEGRLACGDVGKGKMAEPKALEEAVLQEIECRKDLLGLKVLVTAGPTRESVDPVRFLSNRSSGKMGYAIAVSAARRGAQVTLVSGPTALEVPPYMEFVSVESAGEMFDAVVSRAPRQDIIIKAAAVADYRPATVAGDKIKKGEGDLSIPLARTDDILQYLGDHKPEGQFLCGFSMETRNMEENSRRKLEKKHLDMIAANNVKDAGAGFACDTNLLTLITPDSAEHLPLMSKFDAAHRLLDEIIQRRAAR